MMLRRYLALAVFPLLAQTGCTPPTPQGWSAGERMAWYTDSQGSRLIPKAWLLALEQADTPSPFLDANNIASFRYLPLPSGNWVSADPDPGCAIDPRLPLGFTSDCQKDDNFSQTKLRWRTGQSDHEPWVGMNCSACHTNEIDYKGSKILVDGAPTLADFQALTDTLQKALKATLKQPDKFTRFAQAVLGPNPSATDTSLLRTAVTSLYSWNDRLARLNNANGLQYGFGRLDAIGHIYNKVALAATPAPGTPQIANPADAPVSYPFLWNIPQLDKVEWNGIAANSKIEAAGSFNYGGLGRNTGEVIGVFGDLVLAPETGKGGYVSSARVDRLSEMENQLGGLKAPAWPASFPPIDQDLAKAGSALFQARCSTCHTVPSSFGNLTESYTVTLNRAFSKAPATEAVGTDMWMACNAVMDQADTGVVKGNRTDFFSAPVFGDQSSNFALVQNAVVGVLLAQKGLVIEAAIGNLFGFAQGLPQPRPAPEIAVTSAVNLKEKRRAECLAFADTTPPKIVYKGRPLQGIWATAPYLHDGSVPTLYDLLLPPAQRPTQFLLGTREFDPVRVGFVTDKLPDNTFIFKTVGANGAPLDGNANTGHDYGNATMTDDNRKALVEYMKTL